MTVYGKSARHDIHYQFCHVLLPGLALGGGNAAYLIGMLVVEEAPRYLAEFWNSIAGDHPDLRATEQDFAVQMECFTDGWIAFVITPPPALEELEAHQIGVLLDLNEDRVDRIVDDAIPVDERGLAGTGILRYLCLERDDHTPGMAHVGEWLGPGHRVNHGAVLGSSVEAMVEVLADLLGESVVSDNGPVTVPDLADEGEIAAELQDLEAELEDAIADENALEEFECRSILAQAYLDAAQPRRAVVHCEALVELLTRAEGPESERQMIWRGFLGRALTEARRYFEAIDVLSDLLVDRERILGRDDRQTLATRWNLARALAFGGRVDEGILLAERLLADRLRLFGDLDPAVLDTLGHLAQFHSLVGDHGTAVELAEEQLEKRKRVFAEGDPILERTRHNLDALRSRYVKPEEALAGLRGRVDSSIGELGADHPETFTARGLLAEQLLRSGAFDESIGLLEKLLADRVRVLGVNAPATVTTSFMYGRALRECGRPEDSATHLRALVEAAPTEVTTPSPEHLQIRAELVLSLIEAGDQAGALTELQVLGMDMSHLEPTHPLREWAEEMIASLEGT